MADYRERMIHMFSRRRKHPEIAVKCDWLSQARIIIGGKAYSKEEIMRKCMCGNPFEQQARLNTVHGTWLFKEGCAENGNENSWVTAKPTPRVSPMPVLSRYPDDGIQR